jgi:hypothetical protein
MVSRRCAAERPRLICASINGANLQMQQSKWKRREFSEEYAPGAAR